MEKKMLLIIGILFLILQGCSVDDELQIETDSNLEVKSAIIPSYTETERPRTYKSRNQLIVRYDPDVTIRRKKRIRRQNQVINVKKCSCGDASLELWTIQLTEDFGVEEAVKNLAEDTDVEGDYQFHFSLKKNDQNGTIGSSLSREIIVAQPGTDATVNIGIIDSGVDYNLFTRPVLYPTYFKTCQTERSGWDFVNGDNDIKDDHGHGTWVTKLITSKLDKKGIDYRILAVKAFDKNGLGSYWNLICSMNYMTKQSPPMDIVNMSFGWYDITGQTPHILKKMITDAASTTLFVSSAGNAGVNTNNGVRPHFPSGINVYNTIAVGGYTPPGSIFTSSNGNIGGIQLDRRSNYGKHKIDMITSFGPYNVKLEPRGKPSYIQKVSGTSFSCAYTTYRAAKLFSEGVTLPIAIKLNLWQDAKAYNALKNKIRGGKVLFTDQ